MLVTISGVPGTGKTHVAKDLVERLNKDVKSRKNRYKLVDLNKLAKDKEAFIGYDKRRRSKIVEMKSLKNEVKELSKENKNLVVEGLFAHFFDSDILIVLRCNPTSLEKRLKKKYKWQTKIDENVEAELIGVIIEESLPIHKPGTVFEVDTTGKTVKQTSKILESIIENEDERMNYVAGKIDWLGV